MRRGGKYWMGFLTPEEQRKFLHNIEKEGLLDIDFHLSELFNDFSDFIGCAFIWEDTNEGHKYWRIISERTASIEGKRKLKKFVMV